MKWPLLALLLLIVSVARAEMEGGAYRAPGAPGDDAERRHVREAMPPRADAPGPKTDKHAAPSRPPRLEPLVKPRQGTQPAPLGLCDGS